MTTLSIFPVIADLLKGEVPLYGFVPADAHPPYVIYEEGGQTWGFPEVKKGTIAFILKVISTYKGPLEMNRISVRLQQKLEGREVVLEPQGKGMFRFLQQQTKLKDDAITREAILEFQLLVRG